jgi:NAD(P)-dependent dehydrogenase (short-subunit alcohol dehydrogenase family)
VAELEDSIDIRPETSDRFHGIVRENLTTAFLTCREFLRHVRSTGRGDIVLVASTSGVFGEFGQADYAAAKAAVAYGFAKTLKNEIVRLDPAGRVNVVAPGWTLTDDVRAALDDDALASATATRPLKAIARAGCRHDRGPGLADRERSHDRRDRYRGRRHGRAPRAPFVEGTKAQRRCRLAGRRQLRRAEHAAVLAMVFDGAS